MRSTETSRRRPGLWTYLSFSDASQMRRQSVSLPTQNNPSRDPFEKPDRHLHSGSGPSPLYRGAMSQSQRARYLKVAAIISVLFLLFFVFSPKDNRVSTFVGDHAPSYGGKQSPLKTSKCSKSHDSSKPLVQYALMIDAGSTGSRIHVYRFNNCGPTPELESEEFAMTEKRKGGSGLSSYKADSEGAAKSLDPLLAVAMEHVPDPLKSCTPIAVKATAGLRLLGNEMSGKILAAVRNRLETAYPFPVLSDERGGVQIMDGKDEGVYAWITTNYLLGKIGGPDKSPTAATFDLGGGSTQIVFQPTFSSLTGGIPETLEDGDHKYELDFGGQKFVLYQHSHLGYGLMSARESIHKLIVENLAKNRKGNSAWLNEPIVNPCLSQGMNRTIEVKFGSGHPLGESIKANMVGPDTGSHAQCQSLAETILEKDAKCILAPCSFKGIYQPSLEKTFAREDIYVFSYFYDRIHPLGVPDSFTLRDLKRLTSQVCGGEASWTHFESIDGAIAELKDRPEHCLDLNFMLALLNFGYEMPMDREVKTAKKIGGNELGWCLGAR
ncbi:MAG: Guanosine-diphosphatase [Vezdaea aestivalis]|nr:MAG: Guanosine-diphosphatase [Vezdaea aestivalis]